MAKQILHKVFIQSDNKPRLIHTALIEMEVTMLVTRNQYPEYEIETVEYDIQQHDEFTLDIHSGESWLKQHGLGTQS